jgi:hypothetical protein
LAIVRPTNTEPVAEAPFLSAKIRDPLSDPNSCHWTRAAEFVMWNLTFRLLAETRVTLTS